MEILIVEDEFISRNLLKKAIQAMGHQTLEAENGLQAWEMIQDKPVKFVITDWMMPEMDGLELCARIRGQAVHRYIYIIMLTAKDSRQDLVKVLHSGADDFIPKPFNPDELRARLQTGLRIIDLQDKQQRLHHTLLESRNKVRVVFDALREQIVAIDRNLTIMSTNRVFAETARCEPKEVIGKAYSELCKSGRDLDICRPEIGDMLGEVFASGEPRKFLATASDSAGRSTYKEIQCLPVKDDRHNVFQVAVVVKDVSEEMRKAREIQDLNRRLLETSAQIEFKNRKLEAALERLKETQNQMLQSEKMASIGQLAAGVAHEINNPTGFVSSNLKTLTGYHEDIFELIGKYRAFFRDCDLSEGALAVTPEQIAAMEAIKAYEESIEIDFLMEDTRDLITDCCDGTDRIKKIVIDLKDFAHPGEDKMQTTDINAGLASTLNVVNNEIKYKATVTTDYGAIPTVLAYPQQLNHVFMNILVNAAQAIEKQGEIHVATSEKDGFVEVVIRDTGCGIPQENLNKIFDPFFTTKEVGKGTGLGMNIAYNIVQKHKGRLDVQSKVGEGTQFTISIPVEAAE